MKKTSLLFCLLCWLTGLSAQSYIRINQLGYPTASVKVAVWCARSQVAIDVFELVEAASGKTVYKNTAGKPFGAYGPFAATYRLNFSAFRSKGSYFLRAGGVQSPVFAINDSVYKGAADFCLRYMRQQRSGFNPFLKDSCHTHDGYTLYGPMPDSTHINVSGGWHDASDYLQYSTTSANAGFHLLAAYRDFPAVFGDEKLASGLDGRNGTKDVLDEARWGLDWLVKMNPRDDWMFNQLGDDRDHMGMRIPKEDSFYGRGFERPVYFNSGRPQQRGRFMNATTGTASTAGKLAGAFALASQLYAPVDKAYASMLSKKAVAAWNYGLKQPGVAQTASVRSPYIYAEGDWMDDMELAAAQLYSLTGQESYRNAFDQYLQKDSVSKWMGKDTAHHYQFYPFNNLGVYAMARERKNAAAGLMDRYADGLRKVQEKARHNAFNRGIPFIWCSNNLTVSFAIQCYWYRAVSGNSVYAELEQACFDWLFGCNPWGTGMVYGLPSWGDTPADPHSAFTHLKNYPIDGGLVDGPVYTSIYKSLIGITLKDPDEYESLQSDLAVYHDDYGDYSTNEPTMDGTASLIYLLAAKEQEADGMQTTSLTAKPHVSYAEGAVVRGDSTQKNIALVFTGDEFGEGLQPIAQTLQKQQVKASFFFTGRFYRNATFLKDVRRLYASGHLMGSHSDRHLLYSDWTDRSKTLVTKDSLLADLAHGKEAMRSAGIPRAAITPFYIPPYEWWNREVAGWLREAGMLTISFTPGTGSNADYTYPELGASYRTSEEIVTRIKKIAQAPGSGLNGMILLVHAGTDPRRKDKLYDQLDSLIAYLKEKGYAFKKLDELP
ncbi:glycoside hydrolase family 9 protein [Sediminibacterium soli]|uniref:glycoside hydrolase family 9 protein n=1 Tax=Sediminibacterium soli TaxID=2698829 RepID=UPI0013797214|nr:glycoside hydrolase family 9 protein [Sediminibacterium soli]NCI46430.1 polysaccharide deacetylase family protein [Sediminibacterium soli]